MEQSIANVMPIRPRQSSYWFMDFLKTNQYWNFEFFILITDTDKNKIKMEYFSWKFVCFVIIFIRSDFINGIYFKTCNEYKDKMSSSKFIKSEVNHSVYTCGLRCSITNLCDGYTFNTDNRTCSLYRIRELEFINETTTDTQLYLTQSGDMHSLHLYNILRHIKHE
jgi:hypothetical protein